MNHPIPEDVLRLNAFARLRLHPPGFWFVFWGELAERASFYGMKTLLALYLIHVLQFSENTAATIMPVFIAACYLTPLLGAYIAERHVGLYRTILWFSGPYIVGHLILGASATRFALVSSLFLLAFGSGGIKPNTSTLMGRIYEEQKKKVLLEEAFGYFYAAINIGAAASSIALPWLREILIARGSSVENAYAVVLMIPAALMFVAVLAFRAGKRHYPASALAAAPAAASRASSKDERRATVMQFVRIFPLLAVFWFVYDQSSSTWIYFAQKNADLRLFGDFRTTADGIVGFNPAFIVTLTALFNRLWETLKRRRNGVPVDDTTKMLIGFVIVTACMATMSFAGFLSAAGPVTIWWIIAATFVITLSELCISVVGLKFAYLHATPETQSTVTAAFLGMIFLGNIGAAVFNRAFWGTVSPGAYFALQTAIIGAAAICFAYARRTPGGVDAASCSVRGR